MAILLSLLMAYSLLGEAAHEWLGIVMAALFILHHALNWKRILDFVKKERIMMLSLLLVSLALFTACGTAPVSPPVETTQPPIQTQPAQTEQLNPETDIPGPAEVLYQGQASMRLVTDRGKVIYIDPYVGEGYDLPADLILVTHSHYDHNGVDRIESRNPDCRVITWKEALQNGQHQVFDLGYVTVEAVEAGYNRWHDVGECVGYVLTFSNGRSIYVTGDTSTTEQMADMAEMEIDYAFFCCDGVFNMGLEEAAECARLVGARYNIPYHVTASSEIFFDRTLAEQFDVENRLILDIGETLLVE